MSDEIELDSCNLCDGKDFSLLFIGRDYLFFSPLSFNVMRCRSCGLVCLNPRPESMAYYYRAFHKRTLEKDVFAWLSPSRIKIIRKLNKKGTILDVGCGSGSFLYDMYNEGWDVFGNDTSPEACEYVRKTLRLENVYCGSLLSVDLPEKHFDVITLWHVIEHLENPKETVRKIRRLLKDDGVVVIECPDFTSSQSRVFKDKWYNLDLPRHLHQFSPKTLEKLLKTANLKIYKREYIVNHRVSFISLKMSLMRYLGIQRSPNREAQENADTVTDTRNTNIFWKLIRFLINWFCLSLSFFLMLIHSDESLRVYCRKSERE